MLGATLLPRRVGAGVLAVGALVAIVVQGAGLAGPALWLVPALAFAFFFIGGVAHGTKNVLIRTLIHERVPSSLHGRAFAAYNGAAKRGRARRPRRGRPAREHDRRSLDDAAGRRDPDGRRARRARRQSAAPGGAGGERGARVVVGSVRSVAEDFRVEVELDDEAHGYPLRERLRALNLDDEARERLGENVVVTRDGSRVFAYTSTEPQAREAERVIRELVADEDADRRRRRDALASGGGGVEGRVAAASEHVRRGGAASTTSGKRPRRRRPRPEGDVRLAGRRASCGRRDGATGSRASVSRRKVCPRRVAGGT